VADKSTIARPYARAVFQLARESGGFEQWSQRLAIGAAGLRNEQVRQLLDDPRRTFAAQVDVMLDLCGEPNAPDLANFFRTLADNGRLGVLPEIAAAYEAMRDEAEGRIEVEVRSAEPISDAIRASLKSALERRLERAVELQNVIDPSLIGGAIIRAGDLVIDGSVHGRLQGLATALKR
jgi:F-type H+-transporting ATPase subunit delta